MSYHAKRARSSWPHQPEGPGGNSADPAPLGFPPVTQEKGGVMRPNDRISYVMLFCALMLVRNSKMKLEDLAVVCPFTGSAEKLARKLARPHSVIRLMNCNEQL